MCEFRIHIVLPTGIFDLNGLHFIAVWIAIALTMHCHHRTNGNGVLPQAGRRGAERGRQRDVPNLAVRGHDLHGAVRAGELDSLGDRPGQGGDFIDVSAPAVMCKGGNGGCNGNGGGENDCVQAHDILPSWTGGLCRNPWVMGRLKFCASEFVQWKPSPSDWPSLPNCDPVCGQVKDRCWVNGGHSDYDGGRSGVPQIADDLLHGTKSSASGHNRKSSVAAALSRLEVVTQMTLRSGL